MSVVGTSMSSQCIRTRRAIVAVPASVEDEMSQNSSFALSVPYVAKRLP